MKNHWLLILIMSVTAGLVLSYLRDPAAFKFGNSSEHPYIQLSDDKRASILLSEAKDFSTRPLASRFYGMPQPLAQLLGVAARISGRTVRPMPIALARPSPEWETLVESLPEALKAQLAARLEGVYLTSDLGQSSLTEYLYKSFSETRPLAAFIAVDLGTFLYSPGKMTTLDAWMEARESSLFTLTKGDRIEARLEAAPGIDWALEFALLHELGHVFAVNAGVHPSWNLALWSDEKSASYPFMKLSWDIVGGKTYAIHREEDFKLRSKIRYDGHGTIPSSQMKAAYDGLEKGSFTTLYAATNPFDDFAESFATYVHTVVLKRPFELRVIHGGKVVKTMHACWEEKRCAAKRAVLEALLGGGH